MAPEQALLLVLQEIKRRTSADALENLYPDDGPLARSKYVKHQAMLAAGKIHQERVCLGGNRVGKTFSIGGYETALHLTGLYPHWWQGLRFDKPILIWAAGTKGIKVRDTNQKMLTGTLDRSTGRTMATGGLVPASKIGRATRKTGVADALDQVWIEHRLGWTNTLTFKSYEEGRQSFESEAVDFIWLDEEPPKAIYDECKMRLLTTKGRMLSTFTPVEGMTECVMSLLEGTDLL
jgi:phage terminase large subunit-like protein